MRGFRLQVQDGPDRGASLRTEHTDRISLGTAETNDLRLTDRTVSRFHCELTAEDDRVRIRDLGSSNGTFVDGVRVIEAVLGARNVISVGGTRVSFDASDDQSVIEAASATHFGGLVGRSASMRVVIAQLDKAARSQSTVLLEGETGTGKGATAEALHAASPRAAKPFVVVDCSAIPATLLEAELFGHERGAFTGATSARAGSFEQAHGGTLFIDELGELPLALQPKLLRALEGRTIRRIGSNTDRPVDVRIVAATNRELRAEVNAGRFRADLFFRVAVLRITLPPLRARPDDLGPLVNHLLDALCAQSGTPTESTFALRTPEFVEGLAGAPWPGNVRELRNHLERCMVLDAPLAVGAEASEHEAPTVVFADARQRALDAFERRYLTELLERFDGHVAEAASAAKVHRVHFYRLLRRHGIKRE